MVEPVNDNILNLVNELYNNLDAKDKIINEQALEIARLKEENLEIARLRPLIDLLKEENKGIRKGFNNLQQENEQLKELTKQNKELNKRLENEQKVVEEYLKLEDDYELLYNDLDNANSKLSDLMKSHLEAIEYIKNHQYEHRIGGIGFINSNKLLEILGYKEIPKGFKSYEDYKKKEEAFINHFCKGDKE